VPVFTYDQYSNPYANTIAQIIGRQNDPQAQAALAKGNLEMQRILGQANARANMVGSIGNAIAGGLNEYYNPTRRYQAALADLKEKDVAAANALSDYLKHWEQRNVPTGVRSGLPGEMATLPPPTSFSVDYNGKTYSFPNQNALDTFKQQFSIGGETDEEPPT